MNPLNNAVVTVEDICSICTANFKPQDKIIQTGCSHVFHGKCIEEWATTCVEKRNKARKVAKQHLAEFIRNGRRGEPPRDYIPNAGSCPMCRKLLSIKVTAVKVQPKIKENVANANDLRNKPHSNSDITPDNRLSTRIYEAILLRNFTVAKRLIAKGKFYLNLDFMITVLQEDITNNKKDNVKEMLSLIKCISTTTNTTILNTMLNSILDTLLHDNNLEFAQIFRDHLRA